MKRYFITGTDTDCGKTYVTTQLLHHYPRTMAVKPIASGSFFEDAKQLQLHNPIPLTLDEINPWRFQRPVSPHIAAEEEGRQVSLVELADYCLNLEWPDITTLFIEGAGGLIVPLNHQETWVDFLKLTQIPVILVVGIKLGCINHALLTQTAMQANHIHCVGWIANCLDDKMLALEKNKETLRSKLEFPMLACIEFNQPLVDCDLTGSLGANCSNETS